MCPAPSPKSVNVEYFATAEFAAQSGYRPYLRCRPTPGSGLILQVEGEGFPVSKPAAQCRAQAVYDIGPNVDKSRAAGSAVEV
ncbi:MAG: Ada metal-binding domain-containing protein [Exilibacterium sp.]